MSPRLADTRLTETPIAVRPAAARSALSAGPISAQGVGPGGAAGRFGAVLQTAEGGLAKAAEAGASRLADPGTRVTVARGDTLTSLVRDRWQALGGAPEGLDARQAHRWALQVAADNGVSDPNRIRPGQELVLRDRLAGPAGAVDRLAGFAGPTRSVGPTGTAGPTGAVASAPQAAAKIPAQTAAAPPAAAQTAAAPAAAPASPSIAPVLLQSLQQAGSVLMGQTLDRAVQRGFIPAEERTAVQSRIEALADKHGFRPDDFARTVLMESDGLNPQASNGRCFGIIQFCSGPDRGAASAGYARQPQAILRLSVLEQLDLVDRYFDDTRLRDFRGGDGSVRLDDLYLTILTPAARQERRLTAPLPIAGTQALDLHTGRNRAQPITRASILSGLHAVARERLGQFTVARSVGLE